MRHTDREHHADLGLDPEADKTEDLRPGKSDAAGVAAPTASESHHSPKF
jgi:hypothetical protein